MRASTLLGLALALFVGLIVVAGIRFSGILSRTAVTPTKAEPVLVLAARNNLYKGTASTSLDAALRAAVSEADLDFIRRNKDKIMPLTPESAHLRILKRNVLAGEILLKDDFEEMVLPPGVGALTAPGMRAVDVVLPTDRADAGLLRLGEHVDVFLTSTVCTDAAGSNPRTAIAPIARDLKIIVKRGVLYTLLLPVPEDKPVSFILEANPYRAALIEFSKSKGNLTLVASSSQVKSRDIVSPEEQERMERFDRGAASVTEADLERIFRLPPLPAVPQSLRVETYVGGQMRDSTVVQSPIPPIGGRAEGSYHFFIPGDVRLVANAKKDAPGPANNISAKAPPAKNKK